MLMCLRVLRRRLVPGGVASLTVKAESAGANSGLNGAPVLTRVLARAVLHTGRSILLSGTYTSTLDNAAHC
jgi:hypothetical protein